MQLNPDTLLQGGKYRIDHTLGQGGFGITYVVEHTVFGEMMAMKEFFMKDVCNRDADTSRVSVPSIGSQDMVARFKAKFIKEAKTIRRLNHPGIVKIHDVFEENGTAYYVMEYLPDGSLNDWVRAHGAMPEAKALGYIRQIGSALSYAHAQRVMHLDVKPSNIMLDGDRAVLIDFGLAKQYTESGEQTSSTPVGISHGYAPVEQYQDGGVKEFSPATDVYSLGATLYMLVTGTVPPSSLTVAQTGLPAFPTGISEPVQNAIKTAMRFLKQDRPQSVDAFLSLCDLPGDETRFAPGGDDPPVSPVRSNPSGPYAENRLPIFTIAFLAICTLVGLVIVVWLFWVFSGLMDDPSPEYIPIFLGLLACDVGLFMLLFQKKKGFWLLVGGSLLCIILFLVTSNIADGFIEWGAFFVFSGQQLLLVGATYAVLRIKNKRGISGWELLS